MLGLSQQSISYNLYNFVKVYPHHFKVYICKTPFQVLEEGYEESNLRPNRIGIPHQNPSSLLKSVNRTKTAISDIVLCNNFKYFITFTFSKNRDDIKKCKNQLTNWINNTQKKYGKFEYILVPEWHKDHKAVHFHGLFNESFMVPYIDSKSTKKGRKLYNIPSYTLGFSTLAEMDDSPRTSSYIKKYVSKDLYEKTKEQNTKRYWASKNLKRPTKILNIQIPLEAYTHLKETYSFDNLTIYTPDDTLKLQTNDRGKTWKVSTT